MTRIPAFRNALIALLFGLGMAGITTSFATAAPQQGTGTNDQTTIWQAASPEASPDAACNDDDDNQDEQDNATPASGQSDDTSENEEDGEEDDDAQATPGILADGQDLQSQATISLDEAIATAQASAQGDLGAVDLEEENGTLVYKVTIGDQEVIVDATTGQVIGTDTADSSDENNDDENDCDDQGSDTGAPGKLADGKDLQSQATVSLNDAIATAQGSAQGDLGTVDLEDENGKLVYKVTIGDQEVIVDAMTGEIVGTEPVD